ncbi:signal transduction histidine kinase [Aequitasia blattaphilus]|uniref:histidine kinase n=1 Tax=Aequitasia blattaphilus TaxID=2949332 RepID=A0ABT1EB49_9FIRM|nr:sensor histidine kinase [Aequitasia blattaphilus]MCP1101737.1 sensor histidine kinase [Aequitasia blattaphilus]MCR8614377.1 sensor histidine kinase [Aequitasia blattaphilus]
MTYFKKYFKYLFLIFLTILSFNLYFLFLLPTVRKQYLLYLNILLFLILFIFFCIEYYQFRKREQHITDLLTKETIITSEMNAFENKDIALHDIEILNLELQEEYDKLCDLQDYFTKWCHEIKTPLSASLLLTEQIEDSFQKSALREQLEKITRSLNTALLGTKIQSSLLDLTISPTPLLSCVNASIKNNRFFLIRKKFELDINSDNETVYTDAAWLTYVLDQLLSNALKYQGNESPVIKIWSETSSDGIISLHIQDNGEGIKSHDIGRVFEKGFTGSNYHNGKYESTGMGLYMAKIIIDKLGHEIFVESVYTKYTRFTIRFEDNREFFLH